MAEIMTMQGSDIFNLSRVITGRPASLFQNDFLANLLDLKARVSRRRILVVGGAGSLGASTVFQLLSLDPKHITVLDISENNLVELLRTIRSGVCADLTEVNIQPLDFGARATELFLKSEEPFDYVLNFSALKHVRSERDQFSLMQMLDTNLLKADRFLGWLRKYGHGRDGVFFVSSDKAANPANLMGASKWMMEQMLFWHASSASAGRTLLSDTDDVGDPLPRVTTARFANVAFSDGSLPYGFLRRLEKKQPLSGPSDVRRFLLTLEEAGQLCSFASLNCPANHILIPRLNSDFQMVTFKEIAIQTLKYYGFEPRWCESEGEARAIIAGDNGVWPCCFATSDTMGEKLFEEFVGNGDVVVELGYNKLVGLLGGVRPAANDIISVFREINRLISSDGVRITKEMLVSLIKALVPSLHYVDNQKSLDGKM